VHGGVGDGSWSLDSLVTVPRPLTDFAKAPAWVLQALWSDPSDSDADMRRGVHNSPRGGRIVTFGPDARRRVSALGARRGGGPAVRAQVTDRFCRENAVDVVVRSHQYVRRGYKYMHGGRLITLFSARNYFGREKNDAGILLVARDGYGQIRVRPKRLPAVSDGGSYPSLDT